MRVRARRDSTLSADCGGMGAPRQRERGAAASEGDDRSRGTSVASIERGTGREERAGGDKGGKKEKGDKGKLRLEREWSWLTAKRVLKFRRLHLDHSFATVSRADRGRSYRAYNVEPLFPFYTLSPHPPRTYTLLERALGRILLSRNLRVLCSLGDRFRDLACRDKRARCAHVHGRASVFLHGWESGLRG